MTRVCLPFRTVPVFLKDGVQSNPRHGQGGRRIHGFKQETT